MGQSGDRRVAGRGGDRLLWRRRLPAYCDHNRRSPPTTTVPPTTLAVADTAPLPAAAPVVRTGTVPNVVGIDLQLAQDTLQAAGFYVLRSHDATGQGRLQVLDRNWTVVDQTPSGGTVMLLSEVVDLGAVKDEEL